MKKLKKYSNAIVPLVVVVINMTLGISVAELINFALA